MIFEAKDLKKSFEGKTILDGASFRVNEGEIVGIYGASGLGKSTIAKIISGVLPPDGGSWTDLGLKLQMIYQQPYGALDPRQTVEQSFAELIRYHKLAEGKENVRKLTLESLSRVNLGPAILSHKPARISGGEAQRVSIARALLFEPKLLILDEATSMLDVLTQAEVLGLVKKCITEKGGAVLLISHDAELVQYLCGRVYVLKDYVLREYHK